MTGPAAPTLTVRYDGSSRNFAPGNDIVVGRDLRADVRIAHPLISRAHLILRFDRGRWLAIDNGSLNGMFVNGRRVPTIEIGDGMVFANAARSHMAFSLNCLPAARRIEPGFFIGNMIPTCVDDDLAAARAVNRRTLSSYVLLPNYRNYWREAGWVEEMDAVERCIAEQRVEHVGDCLSDAWLDDTTIAGPPSRVREELERWYAAGVTTPILVPSSVKGGQMEAFQELFAVFD